ncbi:MAG: hypothetical protein IJ277_06850 [Bacteroidaceae bacterium]|nr:hypothetical protein [Bacteroidaceae bacterium]
MNILITISDSYVPYAAAMLQTMADTNRELSLDIYIMSPDLKEQNKSKLVRSFEHYGDEQDNIRLYFPEIPVPVKKDIDKMAPHMGKFFDTSYILRLYAPRILPTDIHTILYLDVDTLIASSLKEIGEMKLDEDTALAAVKDLIRPNDYERLGIDERKHIYFNSGIMLLNLDFWRKHDTGEKCLKVLETRKDITFPDQDALNIACEGHVVYLHPRYNCMTFFFARREFLKKRIRKEEFENVLEAQKSPTIIHYTWPNKPWHKGGYIPRREEWLAALAKTEWAQTPIVYKNGIKGEIKHILKSIASYTLPLIGIHSKQDIYRKRHYKHIYWLSILVYYGFAQYLPNFDSRFFGKLSNRIRVMCVKNIFDYVGNGVNIGRRAKFGNGKNIWIGSRSNIGAHCQVPANIIIGDDVMMGPNNFFFGGFTHNISDTTRPMIEQGFKFIDGRTEIKDDVWIGRDCLFMPCVTIGAHSVVGARSVVTKDIPQSVIVGGNPAKNIKQRK